MLHQKVSRTALSAGRAGAQTLKWTNTLGFVVAFVDGSMRIHDNNVGVLTNSLAWTSTRPVA
jgi:hypothetical protein